MKCVKFFGLLSALLFLNACGIEVDPRTLWQNQKAIREYNKGSVSDAQKDYLGALTVDPFIGELHINLGLTYQALQQGESALQSFGAAEKWSRNQTALFASRFNQGVVQGLNKKIDPALEAYQRALEVVPDSLETKTNIELLVQNQGGGEGEGENQDKNQEGKGQDQKKDQNQDPNQGDNKDQEKDQDDKDKEQENKPKEGPKQQSKQYKPREFKGELSENDVKKILGELKQQEQKIRGQFYRGDSKEKPLDKDW